MYWFIFTQKYPCTATWDTLWFNSHYRKFPRGWLMLLCLSCIWSDGETLHDGEKLHNYLTVVHYRTANMRRGHCRNGKKKRLTLSEFIFHLKYTSSLNTKRRLLTELLMELTLICVNLADCRLNTSKHEVLFLVQSWRCHQAQGC